VTIDEQIAAALAAHAPLVALVSDRRFPMLAAQDTRLPFLTWQETARQPEVAHGDIGADAFATVQFSAWGPTLAQARAVRDQVLAAIAASGLQAVATGGNCFLDPASGRYHAVLDLSVWDPAPVA
jgi:hypothetical protein